MAMLVGQPRLLAHPKMIEQIVGAFYQLLPQAQPGTHVRIWFSPSCHCILSDTRWSPRWQEGRVASGPDAPLELVSLAQQVSDTLQVLRDFAKNSCSVLFCRVASCG